MADKKLNQLNQAGTLTVNDIMGLCQNLSTGEMVFESLGVLREFILGGANAGARVYFNAGAPSPLLGVDGDVCFDVQGKDIYSREAGAWVLKDTYGAPDAGTAFMRFTSAYGAGGLSPDGLTFQSNSLIESEVLDVRVDITPLLPVQNWGDIPQFDEFDFDFVTGTLTFGAPLPEGFRIIIYYSF